MAEHPKALPELGSLPPSMQGKKIIDHAVPTAGTDVANKNYVDLTVGSHEGGTDPHPQYVKADGTRAFTGNQSMGSNKLTSVATPTVAADAATKGYVDGEIAAHEAEADPHTGYVLESALIDVSAGAADAGKPIKLDAGGKIDASMIDDADVDHGTLGGLADDDHTQYSLVAGTRAFTGKVAGVGTVGTDPGGTLATKSYVDLVGGGPLTEWDGTGAAPAAAAAGKRMIRTSDQTWFTSDGTRWLSDARWWERWNLAGATIAVDTALWHHNIQAGGADTGVKYPHKVRILTFYIYSGNTPPPEQAIDLEAGGSVIKTLNWDGTTKQAVSTTGWSVAKDTGIRTIYNYTAGTGASNPQAAMLVCEEA